MDTYLSTSFQTVSAFLEERGYIRVIVRIMPFKGRPEEFVEIIGKVI